MRNKQKKTEKNSSKSWEAYGVAFWVIMAIVSAVMALLGLVTFGFALLRILYGDHWFMWFILAASGAGAFALSVFCFDLFPTWASIVRTIRLSDARMAGAMSISQINKYEEREDRRTAEVKDKVQESYTKVGKDVLSTQKQVSEMDIKISRMLKSIENYQNATSSPDSFKSMESSIATLNKRLENYINLTEKSIRSLDSQLSEIKEFNKEREKEELFPTTDDYAFFEDEPAEKKTAEKPESVSESTEQKTEEKEIEPEKVEEENPTEKKARSIFGGPKESSVKTPEKADETETKEESENAGKTKDREISEDVFSDESEDIVFADGENNPGENEDSFEKENSTTEYEDEEGDYFD